MNQPTTPSVEAISRVEGRAIPLRGDDIDTDRIMPARFLRCVTFEGLEDHVFEDDRKAAGGLHPFDRPEFRGASILAVNKNFGCGSSREHAPQGLWRWGIRGIVGESFAEIFFGNCVALGIPCVTLAAEEVEALQDLVEKDPDALVAIDLEAKEVEVRSREGSTKRWEARIPEGARRAFLSGIWDSAGLLLRNPEEIDAVAARLPYVSRWGRRRSEKAAAEE